MLAEQTHQNLAHRDSSDEAVLVLGPNESRSITQSFTNFILAEGTTKGPIRIEFFFEGNIIRTATISTGASFKLRANFNGETREITVVVTNRSDQEIEVRLSLF